MSTIAGTTTSAEPTLLQKLVPSYVTGVILGAIGLFSGYGFVVHFIGTGHVTHGANFTEQALVIGFVCMMLGWLIGIGAANRPIGWLLARPDPDHETELRLAGKGYGAWRYFRFTTDHKVVGIQYLVLTLIMLAFGGLGAMLIRTNLITPGSKALTTQAYNTVVTMHGMLMILTTITFFIGPFGNFFVPLMIGARDMAFPRVEALSFSLILPGIALFLTIPFFGLQQANGTGGGVQTGWTFYAPLADQTGIGATVFAVAVLLVGLSSILGGINIVTTVITMRAPGMRWTRLPMTIWGILGSAILVAVGTGSFAVALLFVILDRVWNTSFFYAAAGGDFASIGTGGGNAWLYQNLFWFFGHPEVYVIVLPAFGIVLDLFAVFTRKPLFGYKTGVVGVMGVVVLSFLVWGHHEFVSGWAPEIRGFYMATTELISIPTGLVFLVALGLLWRGKPWLTIPMLFALSFLWNFVIGGLTGVYLSDVPADLQLHGSMFVTAHFHFTIVGGALMGFFAAVYYWFPKMTGRMMDTTLGWIHFWGVQIGFNVAFLSMIVVGVQGMPRRVADYAPQFATANFITSIFAYLLGASVVVFFFNVAWSWARGEKAVANPWGATTLEWMVPTPVPLENFEQIPVVTGGPHDYGEPAARPSGAPEIAAGGAAS